jgi:hypothetical protein
MLNCNIQNQDADKRGDRCCAAPGEVLQILKEILRYLT